MIGAQIKKLLDANEMTQTELAKKMNVSDSKISKLLKGDAEPNTTDLILLGEIFNVTLDELIIGDNNRHMSLIEKAIVDGEKSFTNLLKQDNSWMTRKDDKGNDMIFYIKKYHAYDLLASSFLIKGNLVASFIQTYYVETIKTLIDKGLFEKSLELTSKQFMWDLSAVCVNDEELEIMDKVTNSADSSLVIHEVILKNKNSSSVFQKYLGKGKYSTVELSKCFIFSYYKRNFDEVLDLYMMDIKANPKYIRNLDLRNKYTLTYLSDSYNLQKEMIAKKEEGKLSSNDFDVLLESLFLGNKSDAIYQLYSVQIDKTDFIDLKEMIKLNNNPQKYFSIQAKYSTEIFDLQNYFRLCVKYHNKKLFVKLLNHPTTLRFALHAQQPRIKELNGYCYTDTPLLPIRLFAFEKPAEYDQMINEYYPELIKK